MLMQFTHRHTSESFRAHSTHQKSYDGDAKTYWYCIWCIYADDVNDDDSISRRTNQESHPSHNPSIANSEELPRKENSFERQEMRKEMFQQPFLFKNS